MNKIIKSIKSIKSTKSTYLIKTLKARLPILTVLSLSLLVACQAPQVQSQTPQVSAQTQAGVQAQSALELSGQVDLKQDPQGDHFEILLTGLNQALQTNNFKTQAVGCGEISVLTISVTGFGIASPSTLTTTATQTSPGQCTFTSSTLPPIPVGKARIVTLQASNAAGDQLAEIKAAVDLVSATNSSFEISYRSHMVARVIEELQSKSPLGKVYSTRQNLNELKAWIDNLTLFNTHSSFPNYSYGRHPMLLKPDILAQGILDNNGSLPAAPPANFAKTTGSVRVLLINGQDTGYTIDLRDPASVPYSQSAPSAVSVDHTFTNVIPGTWRLKIFNTTGREQTVTVNEGQLATVNIDLSAVPPSVPSVNWTRWSVPRAADVVGMAKDGANKYYAGTRGGIYVHSGTDWLSVNDGLPAGLEVRAIAAASQPTERHVFVAMSDNKIYKRDFAITSSWQEVGVSPYPTYPASMLYVDPDNSNQVFVGTVFGQLSRTTNALSGSPSWNSIDGGLSSIDAIQDMVKDTNTGKFFIATNSGGIRGALPPFTGWNPYNSNLSDMNIKALYFNPVQNVLMAGGNNGVVYTSPTTPSIVWTDRGNVGTVRDIVQSLSDINHTIYVATSTGLKTASDVSSYDGVPDAAFTSADLGGSPYPPSAPMNPWLSSFVLDTTGYPLIGTEGAGVNRWSGSAWTDYNIGLNAGSVLALQDAPGSTEIYAGLEGSGVHRLIGDTIGEPMLNMAVDGSERIVTSLAAQANASPAGTYHLFAGTRGAGVWVQNNLQSSTAANTLWAQVGSLPGINVNALLLQPGLALFAATNTALYRTNCIVAGCSGSSSWIQITDSGSDTPTGLSSLTMKPGVPSHLYAGSTAKVYVTTDGTDWSQVNVGSAGQKVVALATLPSPAGDAADNIVYAGLNANGASTYQVWKSTDGGVSFAAMTNPFGDAHVNALVVEPTNINIVYAGTSRGVFVSLDGANSWTAINNSTTGANLTGMDVTSLMLKNGNLYVGTRNHSIYTTSLSACGICV